MSKLFVLSKGLRFFERERLVGHVVCAAFIFDEVSARAWFHFNWFQRSNRDAKPIEVVVDVDFASKDFAQARLVKLLLALSLLWNRVEVSLNFVSIGVGTFVFFVFRRLVRIM